MVALLLPPILVRHMAPSTYAVWVLILQTAAYVSFFDLGLQTAIGRYVAYANEKRDQVLRDSIFSTAFAGLCCAAVVSIAGLAVAIWLAPLFFPRIPTALIPQMRLALLIVGGSMAVELPVSSWGAVFIGLQRYEIPALTIGGSRLLSAAGLAIAAISGQSIISMALVVASANLLSCFARFICISHLAPEIRFQMSLVRRSTARELADYCFGLTIVSFSMLLISGFDLVLVGHFQFSAVTPYSVASSMIALISGLLYATVNVIMPHAAILHAGEKPKDLGRLVINSTRLSVVLLTLTSLPILIYAGPIIRLWIGQRYEGMGTPLLQGLIIANMIRLVGAPYSVILISAGQQNYIKISPLAEGFSNFFVSIVLGWFFGGIGVALGTLFGSCISIASHLSYSMTRTRQTIDFSRRDFLVSGVSIPLLTTSPLLIVAAASLVGVHISTTLFLVAAILSATCAGALLSNARQFLSKQFRVQVDNGSSV